MTGTSPLLLIYDKLESFGSLDYHSSRSNLVGSCSILKREDATRRTTTTL